MIAKNTAIRATALLDILGMRERVKDPIRGQRFMNAFIKIMEDIIRKKDELPGLSSNRRGYLSGWQLDPSIMITSVSDSIVISVPLQLSTWGVRLPPCWSIFVLLQIVFWLQRALLQAGILTRGGLEIGALYHTNQLVVGPALINAYELENNVAVYPRAIIGSLILKEMVEGNLPDVFEFRARMASMVAQDRDGLYFVDYLGTDVMEVETDWDARLSGIQTLLEKLISQSTNTRIFQKLAWLKDYTKRMQHHAEREGQPHPTTGSFETRYPRHEC